MLTAKIEIESLDKESLVFVSTQSTGMTELGPITRTQRYVIKNEDAMKILKFLNLPDFWNRRTEEDMMKMPKLKPCPFCGGGKIIWNRRAEVKGDD